MGILSWTGDLTSPHSLILLVILYSISIYAIVSFFKSAKKISSSKKKEKQTWYPPGMKPYPIIGHVPQFLRNRRRFLDWTTDFLAASPTNTFVFRRPGGFCDVITANPANVEHMLKSHFTNFPKGPNFRTNLHDFLGTGIFNSDGPIWRLQRKTASYEFKTRSLRSFVHHVVSEETSTRLLPLLRRAAVSGERIDLQNVFERFTFDTICKVAFGVDPALLDPIAAASVVGIAAKFPGAFRNAADLSAARFLYTVPRLWKVKKAFGAGCERLLRESIAVVHEYAMQIIRSKKKDRNLRGGCGDDLLSRFIADEDNNSDEFLRDFIISFLLAGRESTSTGLAWFFWLLSSRPDVQRRILEEIADSRARAAGDTLELDELREMHYLHAAVTEAMRLYPPVPFNSTMCCADEVLPDGTEIKKGMFMSYNAYAMGRMEGIWGKDCREYRPERWLDDSGQFKRESPFRYPVFSGGPRVCLGKEMAYIQMKSVTTCVLEGFEVEVLCDKYKCPPHHLSFTLRVGGGLPAIIRERRKEGEIK